MKEVNNKIRQEIIDGINAVRTNKGIKTLIKENEKKTVGNNGYALGQTWTLTGKLEPACEVEIGGKVVATYIGLETDEGTFLSLQKLMNISSNSGYSETEGAINEVAETRKDANGKNVVIPVPTTVMPEVVDNFDFTSRWKPDTRDLYDMAALIKENPDLIQGKTVTYLGKIVRQITAKKDSPAGSSETYKKGYKRALIAPIFSLE